MRRQLSCISANLLKEMDNKIINIFAKSYNSITKVSLDELQYNTLLEMILDISLEKIFDFQDRN